MSQYKSDLFELVKNKEYRFYKLYINDVCYFDDFVKELQRMPKIIPKLNGIYRIMEMLSSHIMLPKEKFRKIENIKRNDIYEFKYKPIRVFVIIQKPDVYIVTGCVKNEQDKTIKRFDKKLKDFKHIQP